MSTDICPKCHNHKPCGCDYELLESVRKAIQEEAELEKFPYECSVCGLRSNSKEKLFSNGRCINCDSPLEEEEE